VEANGAGEAARCSPGTVISAGVPKRRIDTSAGAISLRWPSQAASATAVSGGSASAESSSCAAFHPAAPETTATSVAAAAPSAQSLSQGLQCALFDAGRASPCRLRDTLYRCTALLQTLRQGAQRAGRGHGRHGLGEVPRGRRRGGEPLERVPQPRVVPGALSVPRPERVDEEEQDADGHDPGSDRRDEVVGLPQPPVVVRV